MLEQFLARSGELLHLGILGVAVVEGSWKSNVTIHLHGSMEDPGGSLGMCLTLCWTSLWWALMPLLSAPTV